MLQNIEVLLAEKCLEKDEQSGRFVADLMENHLCSCPRSLAHKGSVVFLFILQLVPCTLGEKTLNGRVQFDLLGHQITFLVNYI
jgi:hypothetical protein